MLMESFPQHPGVWLHISTICGNSLHHVGSITAQDFSSPKISAHPARDPIPAAEGKKWTVG